MWTTESTKNRIQPAGWAKGVETMRRFVYKTWVRKQEHEHRWTENRISIFRGSFKSILPSSQDRNRTWVNACGHAATAWKSHRSRCSTPPTNGWLLDFGLTETDGDSPRINMGLKTELRVYAFHLDWLGLMRARINHLSFGRGRPQSTIYDRIVSASFSGFSCRNKLILPDTIAGCFIFFFSLLFFYSAAGLCVILIFWWLN